MNVIIIILIDSSKVSNEFKRIQLTNLCDYGHTYFVYGKSAGDSDPDIPECQETMKDGDTNNEYSAPKEYRKDKYSDIYCKKTETFKNIIYKTVDTLEYLNDKGLINKDTIVLRTNMSTLFDYMRIRELIKETGETSDLYGGPFIGGVGTVPMISGTGVFMGYNKIMDIISNRELVNINLNEDINLQMMISRPYRTFNIPRLDYLDDTVLCHKCYKHENVCMYRFKSANREIDISRMIELIGRKFEKIEERGEIREELPMYGKLFKKPILIS